MPGDCRRPDACAEYFSKIPPLSYKTLVVILALFSLFVSNLGLTN